MKYWSLCQHDIPIICLLQHQSLREPGMMQKNPIRLLDSALQQEQSLATAPSSAPAGLTLLEYFCPTEATDFAIIHTLYGVCSVEGAAGLHPKVYEQQTQLQR